MKGDINNPTNPFKFNPSWLKEDGFIALTKDIWVPFDSTSGSSASYQLAKNLNSFKKATLDWSIEKMKLDDQELKEVEEALLKVYDSEGGGYLSWEDKELSVSLERKKRKLLGEKEVAWRLKSRAIKLKCGDENTKLF